MFDKIKKSIIRLLIAPYIDEVADCLHDWINDSEGCITASDVQGELANCLEWVGLYDAGTRTECPICGQIKKGWQLVFDEKSQSYLCKKCGDRLTKRACSACCDTFPIHELEMVDGGEHLGKKQWLYFCQGCREEIRSEE